MEPGAWIKIGHDLARKSSEIILSRSCFDKLRVSGGYFLIFGTKPVINKIDAR
jgi:hypothetical protein